MKKLLVILFFTLVTINAQNFTVEKVSGEVKLLQGTSENWENVKTGQILTSTDLLLTEEKSLVQLVKNDEKFLIKGDVAIGLNHIKQITVNELILALTLDEIRNVPKIKRNSLSKNTAVYGSEVKNSSNIQITDEILGEKKINGAKLLNENGYVESSIIAAKEVFRNYPQLANDFEDRLYFADLLKDLELYQEASSEYRRIEKINLTEEQNTLIEKRSEEVNLKLMDK